MAELVIIADDLTGALDSAAPFATRGFRTSVALTPHALPEALHGGAEIVAVSTNSREAPADVARLQVGKCIAALPAGMQLFKKIDSRLKGNIAAELDALSYERSLVVPAIPAFDRWQRDGLLGGFGIDGTLDIAARLGRHSRRATIPNVQGQDEIEAALAAAKGHLPIGARALAEAIAARMKPQGEPPQSPPRATNALVVVGSTDPITLAQLDDLRAHDDEIVEIDAPAGRGPASLPAPSRLTIVQATQSEEAAEPGTVAKRLAELVQRLAPAPGTLLVITGGATAHAVLSQLQVSCIDLSGEAMPGLPLARAGGLTLITKSGGFGEKNCLRRVLASMTGPSEEETG